MTLCIARPRPGCDSSGLLPELTAAIIFATAAPPPLSGSALAEDLFGRRLGRIELLGDEIEAAVPEAGIGQIDADDPGELLGRARTAAREHLQI